MSALTFIFIVVGVVMTTLYHKARQGAAWHRAAGELGLAYEDSLFSSPTLNGRVDGFSVAVSTDGRGQAGNGLVFCVEGNGLPSDLSLTREGPRSWLVKLTTGGEDLLTGHPSFDERIFVQGPPFETLARLDKTARHRILTALSVSTTRVEGGEILRQLPDATPRTRDLVHHVRELVSLAQSLRLEEPAPEKLADNVEHETRPGVRLRNLRQLQMLPSHPATTRASRLAAGDRDPRLRLEGAMFLGEEGFAALVQLVEPPDTAAGKRPSRIPVAVRVQALRHLVEQFDAERLTPLLRTQIGRGAPRLLQAAIEGAGDLRIAALLPALRGRIPSADEETALILATAIARIGGPEVEPDLLRLLEHDSLQVRKEAARGLGEHGSVRAVPALRRCLVGPLTLLQLRRTAQRAIDRIQGRLEGAESGQLVLVDATTAGHGALSLVGAAGGELAMADSDADELD